MHTGREDSPSGLKTDAGASGMCELKTNKGLGPIPSKRLEEPFLRRDTQPKVGLFGACCVCQLLFVAALSLDFDPDRAGPSRSG